jgi:hypothetical protein
VAAFTAPELTSSALWVTNEDCREDAIALLSIDGAVTEDRLKEVAALRGVRRVQL